MPEIKLDYLTLIVIQCGEGSADLPRQFGSLGIMAAGGRAVRHINRQLVLRMVLPVRFHPESESDTVYPEFRGHLSDPPGQIDRHLGGFILKFRRIPFRILAPRHLIPRPFRRRSYWISIRKDGVSQSQCAPAGLDHPGESFRRLIAQA
jgi:hypothetical protein